jgi:hypothetical protein
MSAAQGFSVKWEPEKAQVSTSGDLGYTTGTYEFVSQGVTERGKYVTTWRKDAGEWKVTEDIFNASGPPAVSHLFKPPASVSWGPAPPGLPPGAKLAVLVGDPANPNPFVIRAQVPAGYRVPPHWHPTIENLTILTGTVALGMGETWDDRALTELPPSGYAVMPAESRHFFLAKTAATFQIHGVGPFAITYVNAADDPRQKK